MKIAALVGQNENGILRHLSRGLMDLLEPSGVEGHVIDLLQPDWPGKLDRLVQDGLLMAWGHAGIGANLKVDGHSFWERVKIPFVSILADPPFWMPANHRVRSQYVINAYLYPEWLKFQRRFIRSEQIGALLTGGLIPYPGADSIPWADRPRRMVLVKTGGNPEERRRAWSVLPRRTLGALQDACDAAVRLPTGDITPLVMECFDANGLDLEGRPEVLFGLMREIDFYVREFRSTALVRALLDLPVDVYGRGWDHVSHAATRARFHAAIDADALPQIYAETQFLLNTTPNFSSGVHERVAYGLAAKCCVVSDVNAYMRERLADIPTFVGLDLVDGSAAATLHDLYVGSRDYGEVTAPGAAFVAREYDGLRYMRDILELSMEVRSAERFGSLAAA